MGDLQHSNNLLMEMSVLSGVRVLCDDILAGEEDLESSFITPIRGGDRNVLEKWGKMIPTW